MKLFESTYFKIKMTKSSIYINENLFSQIKNNRGLIFVLLQIFSHK
jgi:hypothetical protein